MGWFAARGVKLKTERDGRMFPTSDSSTTIIDCLMRAAAAAGVKPRAGCGVERVVKQSSPGFELTLTGGESMACDRLLLATGGCRTTAGGELAVSLGHNLEPPVPSLFTFHIDTPWLRALSGLSVESAQVSVPATGLRERGALLMTHWGLSGPVILRLSAWGARVLHALNYQFPLLIHWLPDFNAEQIAAGFGSHRKSHPARLIVNTPIPPLPVRLWEQLVLFAGIARDTRWAALSSAGQHALIQRLIRSEFKVTGKSPNKDEFVTCGGIHRPVIFSPETGFRRKKRSCLDSGPSLTRCSSTNPTSFPTMPNVTKSSLGFALSVLTIFVIFARASRASSWKFPTARLI